MTKVWYTGQQAATLMEAAEAKGSLYLTTDYDFAAGYGTVFALTVRPEAKVFDTTDKAQVEEVVNLLFENYSDELLPYDLHNTITWTINETGSVEDAKAKLVEEITPDHIREDSIYDMGDLQYWLWDTFKFDLVMFRDEDTALLLNAVEMAEEVKTMTTAEKIAQLLGDGQTWETEDGRTLEEMAKEHDAVITTHPDKHYLTRYLFNDGSAIVASEGAWDIEGKEPWSWTCDD